MRAQIATLPRRSVSIPLAVGTTDDHIFAHRQFVSKTPIDRKELAPIYSNRSASFLKLSKVSQALQDAEKCVELRPDWDKAHFRKAAALEANDNDDEALIEFEVRVCPKPCCISAGSLF